MNYFMSIPAIGDRATRRFDSARLKDIRKRLDSGLCEQDELDRITVDLLDECAEVRIETCVAMSLLTRLARERLHR